ncbi:putative selenate ABC transporter substrate-binding protein [Bacillus canaveralius]|uniref:Selenate ABC transporter substrate-binding protein n=1 Tax=Bacillus canaveralius TaxID=1403243 RepID=A0A2N5GLF7_9BACI|nr:putative selenate ABC transporter substrate-binding protein [Bacillus canaveralius]PLR82475.1 putative selenate ABC transporter substrate-binding protein [Bacillus canaveralius]PLR95646.1 putative selenate ABC transporter substrate-binding protein [Bacillus canaveralius]RSK47624.1 putative selenate ABC transporter substrate-binding protein [Bacillus canaveralius]
MRKWIVLLLSTFLLAACSSNGSEQTTEDVFKIGAIPDQSAADLNRSMEETAKYLHDETGLKVEYVPSVDYAALVTAFERGEIHLAWFGGLTGVQARSLVPESEAIAQRPIDEQFHSVFIAQKGLNLQSLEDLKSLSFTFGSESSTSGHLMPRYYLMEAGIDPNTDFDGEPNFSGSHDKTYKLVESGSFQAGALNEAVWTSAVKENKVDTSKVDVFYTTPAYYDYNWTVNDVDDQFGKGTKEKITNALLSMDEEQKEILDLFFTDRFIKTESANYKAIEEVAKELEIIK